MAVVDLPDPTQPPPTVNHGSTDDLLSQLAGEEIDRLLADTDAEGDIAAAGATPAESESRQQSAQAVPPPAAATPAASLGPIPAETTRPREEAPSAPIEAPADLASVLGPLSVSANPAASPPPNVPQPPVVAPPAAAPATSPPAALVAAPATVEPMDSAAIVAAELEAADAERMALRGKAVPAAAKPDAGVEPDTFDLSDEPAAPALPMLLRPLEWLNAPFASSGDDTRESIGKVALITLVNAVGILIYVFFFRRR